MSPESPLTGTSYRAYRNARGKRRIAKASGPCCLCGRAGAPPGILIVVDHCHLCGIIRGELCNGCNNRMRFADEAANGFALYTPGWLREVNAINAEFGHPLTTIAAEIDRAMRELHRFLTDAGPSAVFAYQSQCRCPGIDDHQERGSPAGRYGAGPGLVTP